MRRATRAGMTMLEIMVALAILSIATLLLLTALSSAQQANAVASERTAATNAIRAYIEAMRQMYPSSSSSSDMSGFMTDTTTPVAYIASGNNAGDKLEKTVLNDPQALVLKGNDEKGAAWGASATSAGWAWTDATMATAGAINMAPSASALAACYNGTTGLDLNGDGAITGPIANNKLVRVPCEITLSWRTLSNKGADTPSGLNATQYTRQRITVYAVFSPQH